MGVSYSLVALDPDRLKTAIATLHDRPLETTEQVTSLFAEFDRVPDEDLLKYWDLEPGEDKSYYRYEFITQLASIKRWELDKSLHSERLGLSLSVIPELKPIPLIRFDGFDVELPKVPIDFDSGLTGAWTAQAVDLWKPVTESFSDRASVENYQMPRLSLLGRAAGRPDKIKAAIETWQEDYYWECWCEIVSAVRYTCEHRTHLGFEMFM